jgi:O-antigen/teichoic acid export membrane protein
MVVKYMGEAVAQNDLKRAAAAVKLGMFAEALTSLVAFGALAALAPVGAVYFAHDATTQPLFLIFGLSILANLIYESSTGVLQVTNHYRSQALINFVQAVLVTVLIAAAAFWHAELTTVVWIYLLGKVILGMGPALVALYWLPRTLGAGWWRTPLTALPSWKEVVRFSFSSNLFATVNLFARDNEVPIVSFFFGTEAAGYFKMALALINLIVMPINPFISTTFPEITRAFAVHQWQRLRSLLRRITLISGGWTLAVILGLWIGYPLIFQSWSFFGLPISFLTEYAPAYPALMIMLVGYGAANIFFWNRPLLLAQGEAGYPLRVSFWAMLVKVALTLVLLPRTNYLVEAVLLSAYLIVTVGLIVWRGMQGIRHAEILSPMESEPA